MTNLIKYDESSKRSFYDKTREQVGATKVLKVQDQNGIDYLEYLAHLAAEYHRHFKKRRANDISNLFDPSNDRAQIASFLLKFVPTSKDSDSFTGTKMLDLIDLAASSTDKKFKEVKKTYNGLNITKAEITLDQTVTHLNGVMVEQLTEKG